MTIDNLNMHSYSDAIFFCDKLVTLSNNNLACVYLLGECYFRNCDFKKVHSLFQNYKLLAHNISFQLLAARALLLNKQYDQCLSVLELQLDNTYFNRKMEACRASLRGQCYEAQENKQMAVEQYQECINKDHTNMEAFSRLVDCQLVSGVQKEQLLAGINFAPEDLWLKKIYFSKIKNIEDTAQPAPMLEEEVRKENLFEALVSKDNIHILCIRANTLHQNYQIPAAYELCLKAIKKDPLCF